MKNRIHQTPAETLAANSETMVTVLLAQSKKLEEIARLIQGQSQSDPVSQLNGFLGIIKHQQKGHRKLEEIKSAQLATNITLKKVEKAVSREPQKFPTIPKFPEIPKADFSETNKLLKNLLDEMKKQCVITLQLE